LWVLLLLLFGVGSAAAAPAHVVVILVVFLSFSLVGFSCTRFSWFCSPSVSLRVGFVFCFCFLFCCVLPSFLSFLLVAVGFCFGCERFVVVELLLIGLLGFWDCFIILVFWGVAVCLGGGGD
jgi:hypothetical protein